MLLAVWANESLLRNLSFLMTVRENIGQSFLQGCWGDQISCRDVISLLHFFLEQAEKSQMKWFKISVSSYSGFPNIEFCIAKIQVCLLNLECFHFDGSSFKCSSLTFLIKSFSFNETMCSHQIGYFLFYKGHSVFYKVFYKVFYIVFYKGPSSGSQPCLNRCAAAHLAEAHGTPVCRGTPVENHCSLTGNYLTAHS